MTPVPPTGLNPDPSKPDPSKLDPSELAPSELDPSKFPDLGPRLASAAALVAVGLAAVWAGGWWFLALVSLSAAVMVWELHRMLASPDQAGHALPMAAVAGASVALSGLLPVGFVLPLALAPSFVGISVLPVNRRIFAGYAALIVLAGFGVVHVRAEFGLIWMLWLLGVVVATDIAGYFAGRLLGGPKFWPRVSPKKTWSGTVAGWFAAALVGWGFVIWAGAAPELIGLSIALSMAAQMGDISESAVKRRVGVKDASNLIPGHGGLLDRFDGLLGAAVLLLVVEQMVDFPPLAG